jgi:hypothetical protein
MQLIDIFSNVVLSSVTQVAAEDVEVTGFLPMIGRVYRGQLMVVGRAVNGWTDGITPKTLRDDARRREYAQQVYNSVTENMATKCPMSWVTAYWGVTDYWGVTEEKNYNTRRSAYWRVIRAVVSRLNIANVNDDENPWPSHLIWSNLYKIAPAEGGNPNTILCRAQFNGCVQILQWELENYRPRRLLFLTGRTWADPFLAKVWNDRAEPDRHSFVEVVGHVACGPQHAATCVVACHPQGRNETDWVNEVVAAFD